MAPRPPVLVVASMAGAQLDAPCSTPHSHVAAGSLSQHTSSQLSLLVTELAYG